MIKIESHHTKTSFTFLIVLKTKLSLGGWQFVTSSRHNLGTDSAEFTLIFGLSLHNTDATSYPINQIPWNRHNPETSYRTSTTTRAKAKAK